MTFDFFFIIFVLVVREKKLCNQNTKRWKAKMHSWAQFIVVYNTFDDDGGGCCTCHFVIALRAYSVSDTNNNKV